MLDYQFHVRSLKKKIRTHSGIFYVLAALSFISLLFAITIYLFVLGVLYGAYLIGTGSIAMSVTRSRRVQAVRSYKKVILSLSLVTLLVILVFFLVIFQTGEYFLIYQVVIQFLSFFFFFVAYRMASAYCKLLTSTEIRFLSQENLERGIREEPIQTFQSVQPYPGQQQYTMGLFLQPRNTNQQYQYYPPAPEVYHQTAPTANTNSYVLHPASPQ